MGYCVLMYFWGAQTDWQEERRSFTARLLYGLLIVSALAVGWFRIDQTLIFIVVVSLIAQSAVNAYALPMKAAWLPNLNFLSHRLQVALTLGASGAANSPLIIVAYMFLVSSLVWYRDSRSVLIHLGSYLIALWIGTAVALQLGFTVTLDYMLSHSLGLGVISWLMAAPIRRLDQQARRDGLTGLLNRRSGLEQLEGWIALRRSFSLVFIDVEGFKSINDAHGHAVGDEVLIAVASMLSEGVRQSDLTIRYGGDEFIIGALGSAETLLSRLESAVTDLTTQQHPAVYLNFGVARFPEEAARLEELLALADRRMYAHKRKRAALTARAAPPRSSRR
jgi:diguanylate cyclase (GGDEF)-like protein